MKGPKFPFEGRYIAMLESLVAIGKQGMKRAKPKEEKAPRPAERSAHFGKRKRVVQARVIEKYGETEIEVYKPMVLKNALKAGLSFKW